MKVTMQVCVIILIPHGTAIICVFLCTTIAQKTEAKKSELEEQLSQLSQNAYENSEKVSELLQQNKSMSKKLRANNSEIEDLNDQNQELSATCKDFIREKKDDKATIEGKVY